MTKCICETCAKSSTCRFGRELVAALNNLGTMVSKEARAQIREIVAKDISCGDYHQK